MIEYNNYKQVNGPKGTRFLGNLTDFQKNPLQFMSSLAREYEDVAQFRLGPFQNIFLVSSPALIKEILVTKQKNFIKSKDLKVLKDLVGEGLLTSEKDFHLKQRRAIQPVFKHTHISKYAQDMIDTTYSYTDQWISKEITQVNEDMMNITLGIISKTMFSMEFDHGNEIIGHPLDTYMRLAVKRMRTLLPLPLWLPSKSNKRYKRAISDLDDVLYKIINSRKIGAENYNDLLGMLMAAKDDESGVGMSDKQLRDELMTIFLAGHETTGNALTWAFYLLSKHPEIEQKLYDEINKVVGSRNIEPADFKQLKYTQNVVWETMRLFPPAYVIGRKVDHDVEIGDYYFKKGDMILISQYVMHRDSKYFYKPESFIPERFDNDFLKTIPDYTYFPFGGGPRVCIGNHFAVMEAVLVIACICQRFRLTLLDDHPAVLPQPLITLRPKRGLRMNIFKREM